MCLRILILCFGLLFGFVSCQFGFSNQRQALSSFLNQNFFPGSRRSYQQYPREPGSIIFESDDQTYNNGRPQNYEYEPNFYSPAQNFRPQQGFNRPQEAYRPNNQQNTNQPFSRPQNQNSGSQGFNRPQNFNQQGEYRPNNPQNFGAPGFNRPDFDVTTQGVKTPKFFPDSADRREDRQDNFDFEDRNGELERPTTELPMLTPVQFSAREGFSFPEFQKPCKTIDGDTGVCGNINQCPQYLRLINSARADPEVKQMLQKAHCGFEGKTPKVCCPSNGIPTALPAFTTTTEVTTTTTTPQPDYDLDSDSMFYEPPVCGFSNATWGRVIGGVPAKLGDFPWMALLGYHRRDKSNPSPSWLCGGTLISNKHVITAAHCIHNRENQLYIVRLGELDIEREDDGATPTDILIKKIIKHPSYNTRTFTDDVGMLVLERSVSFTNLISPICIPKDTQLRSNTFENYKPVIAGWGITEYQTKAVLPHLQVLQLPVVSNEFCSTAYSKIKTANVIDDRVICAGYKKGGKDACQGDSGGPLMQPIWDTKTTNFYLIGVISYGFKCAEPGFPGVYMRVTHYVPWIRETMSQNQ